MDAPQNPLKAFWRKLSKPSDMGQPAPTADNAMCVSRYFM